MKKDFRAVLFDLDGTLTDTLADIAAAMNRALALHGLPGWETDAYRYLVGNGARTLAARAVRGRIAKTARNSRNTPPRKSGPARPVNQVDIK